MWCDECPLVAQSGHSDCAPSSLSLLARSIPIPADGDTVCSQTCTCNLFFVLITKTMRTKNGCSFVSCIKLIRLISAFCVCPRQGYARPSDLQRQRIGCGGFITGTPIVALSSLARRPVLRRHQSLMLLVLHPGCLVVRPETRKYS